jgi:fatty-acyl-CoA synthase
VPSPTDVIDSLCRSNLDADGVLDRAAAAHGDRIGIVDGDRRWTYAQLHERCTRLAGGLARLASGRLVAVLASEHARPARVELRGAVGGRSAGRGEHPLSAGEVAYIVEHSKASVLIHGPSFDELVDTALAQLDPPPHRIRTGQQYEQLLVGAEPLHLVPTHERSLLSINYTRGTIGRPKGVMCHYRGAYLQALAMVGHTGLTPSSVHLWTLPMFHCDGWCFPWAVIAARRPTSACPRWTRPGCGG